MKRLVIDLDGTLTLAETADYMNAAPNPEVIARLRTYRAQGFEIVIHTARNMRTHQNSMGRIVARTVPVIIDWLTRHDVPYDEIWVGKPWCGNEGFYVDDKALRPDEFTRLSYDEIRALLKLAPSPD